MLVRFLPLHHPHLKLAETTYVAICNISEIHSASVFSLVIFASAVQYEHINESAVESLPADLGRDLPSRAKYPNAGLFRLSRATSTRWTATHSNA